MRAMAFHFRIVELAFECREQDELGCKDKLIMQHMVAKIWWC